jgi:hypothetical protein
VHVPGDFLVQPIRYRVVSCSSIGFKVCLFCTEKRPTELVFCHCNFVVPDLVKNLEVEVDLILESSISRLEFF